MKTQFPRFVTAFVITSVFVAVAHAQAAGAGANFNKAERAQIQERARLERVDPPIRPDPLGNAIIGGVVSGAFKGAVTAGAGSISDAVKAGAAAGALSMSRGAAVGTAVQGAKDAVQKGK
jgi:uncharacterized membrane-anchored protein YitT (DUF2179 family)